MSQFEGAPRSNRKPSPNVYTVLMLVAFLALATAVGVVYVKSTELTGNTNPFFLVGGN